jgi:hypothetical protein
MYGRGVNSTINSQIHPGRLMLETSTFLDLIQAFYLKNPFGIGENTTIIVSINGVQFHHITLLVNNSATACPFTLP